MEWKNYIVTKTLLREQMLDEFRYFISELKDQSNDSIQVLFSFAWGVAAYGEDSDWFYQNMCENDLLSKIDRLERESEGEIGSDDLYITFDHADYEIQFCHESDVHIWFNEENEFIKSVKNRWEKAGFSPELHSET